MLGEELSYQVARSVERNATFILVQKNSSEPNTNVSNSSFTLLRQNARIPAKSAEALIEQEAKEKFPLPEGLSIHGVLNRLPLQEENPSDEVLFNPDKHLSSLSTLIGKLPDVRRLTNASTKERGRLENHISRITRKIEGLYGELDNNQDNLSENQKERFEQIRLKLEQKRIYL